MRKKHYGGKSKRYAKGGKRLSTYRIQRGGGRL